MRILPELEKEDGADLVALDGASVDESTIIASYISRQEREVQTIEVDLDDRAFINDKTELLSYELLGIAKAHFCRPETYMGQREAISLGVLLDRS